MRCISVEVSDPHSHDSATSMKRLDWCFRDQRIRVCFRHVTCGLWLIGCLFGEGHPEESKTKQSEKSFCSTGLSWSINWAKKTQFGRKLSNSLQKDRRKMKLLCFDGKQNSKRKKWCFQRIIPSTFSRGVGLGVSFRMLTNLECTDSLALCLSSVAICHSLCW